MKNCRVSFKDIEGIVHSVEVQAETMYEAAVLGLKALKRSDWIEVIGPGTRIVIQVHEPPVEHFLMFAQLQRWLEGGATNPAELVKKKRLKELLAH
jgi:hypothetical protein